MAFSDVFFPDNPKRREHVIRLHQELVDSIDSNFDVTNDLIGLLNTHLGGKITPIKMKENGTIKENCDILIETMNKIQEMLQGIDEKMKKNLEPSLYRKLHDVTESDTTKMKIIQSASNILADIVGSAAAGIIIKLVLKRVSLLALTNVVSIVAKIGASVFGLAAGVAIGVTVDMIFSAVLGAIEKKQLEESIQELEGHLNEFKPASKEYQKAIMGVIITISDK
ncbi:single-pass membrane and coiled-coil domain-containing protein 3-like [Emydura macquarii macquarii]|uniref:single-pass membrane and coiled-coil domain-containing protein 3-like n=1 Tax=Emydura macquarii macquarii TaxID=1129001 RepID=UPI00352B81A5